MKKNILFFTILFLFFTTLQAQNKERASPHTKTSGKLSGANVTLEYGQPSVKGRKIWGALVPYGEIWRTGADEATTFEIDKAVKIEGKDLAAGKYALFTIPNENEWTIVFNKDAKQWGAYGYNQDKDVLRVKVKPGKSGGLTEKLTFALDEKAGTVNILWENVAVAFSVK